MSSTLVAGLAAAMVMACGDDGGNSDPDSGFPDEVRPSKRSDVAGITDPTTGTIAVFGGDDGPIVNQTPSPAYRADTWVLDPAAGWSEVTANGPSARGRYGGAYDPDGRMLVFGGRFRTAGTTGDYTLYNDTWAFDFMARTWTRVDDGATAPAARSFPTSAFDPGSDKLYVFGGDTNPAALGVTPDMNVWSFDGGQWQQEGAVGSAPSTRLFMAYTYDSSRNRLVVFGGQVGDFITPSFNDTYALDLDLMTWSQLHDGAGAAPSGRFSSALFYDTSADRYLLFGGHADPGVTNDIWSFDPSANTWTELASGDDFTGGALGCLNNPREIPVGYVTEDLAAPERRSGGVVGMVDGAVWLFGGESDCSDHLDDLWRFDPTSATWSEVIEARSGESCARRNDACECLCL
jgi:hypothetical protein